MTETTTPAPNSAKNTADFLNFVVKLAQLERDAIQTRMQFDLTVARLLPEASLAEVRGLIGKHLPGIAVLRFPGLPAQAPAAPVTGDATASMAEAAPAAAVQ